MIDLKTIETYREIKHDVDAAFVEAGINGDHQLEHALYTLSDNMKVDLDRPTDSIQFASDVRFTLDCCTPRKETQIFIDRIVTVLKDME